MLLGTGAAACIPNALKVFAAGWGALPNAPKPCAGTDWANGSPPRSANRSTAGALGCAGTATGAGAGAGAGCTTGGGTAVEFTWLPVRGLSRPEVDCVVLCDWELTTKLGVVSPNKCLSGLGSGVEFAVELLTGTCEGGMYQRFLSYFCIIKSLILCSSLESGSGGEFEFHKPNHVFLQNSFPDFCNVSIS